MMNEKWKGHIRRFGINMLALSCIASVYCIDWHIPVLPAEYRVFFFNETASLPKGVYIRIPSWSLSDGDYVIYQPTDVTTTIATARGWMRPNEVFLKKIGAVAGESYSITHDNLEFYIKNKYIGQVVPKDHNNDSMPYSTGKFTVPEDAFLPIGTNPKSFDGRYTGVVPIKNIYAKVFPVITW